LDVATRLVVREEYPLTELVRDDLKKLKMEISDIVKIQHNLRFDMREYQKLVKPEYFTTLLIPQETWDGMPKYLQ